MKWTILLSLFAFSEGDESSKFLANIIGNLNSVVDVTERAASVGEKTESLLLAGGNSDVSDNDQLANLLAGGLTNTSGVEHANVDEAPPPGDSAAQIAANTNAAEIVIDADEAPPGAQTPASTQECSRGAMVDGECSIYLNKANKTELQEAYKGECSDA